MKKLNLIIAALLFSVASWAADIDGKWKVDAAEGQKGGAGAFSLKAEGDKLTGTVGKDAIVDGKIDGDAFSFYMNRNTKKKGEIRVKWEGKVSGDTITGTRGRDGGKRSQPFTAKRS